MTLKKNNEQSLWIQPYKLISPALHPKTLVRERLLTLLDQAQSVPLTSICSPAGFGKSTLVLQWLHQRKHRYGWYAIDQHDNDPAVFISHLIVALHNASGGGCPETLAVVQSQQTANVDSLLSKAMIEIATLGQPCFIVFDDAHEIKHPIIEQALKQWLKVLPRQVHVILCYQSTAPLPLSSFRVRGQLFEIGVEQLVFNAIEAQTFLKRTAEFDVPEDRIKTLLEQTGGWPAALQLLLHNARDASDLIDASGRLGHGALEADAFLIEEVLLQQPEPLQRLLTTVSVLEQFDEALAKAMTGDADCAQKLFQLEQRQLFSVRVESGRRWYQLQTIFRHSLQRHIWQTAPETFQSLQRRAVEAYLRCDCALEAVHLALQLGEATGLQRVLRDVGERLYREGQFETLDRLFKALPVVQRAEDSQLALLYAWLLLATYRESEVVPLLDDVANHQGDLPKELRAEYQVAQAQAAINREAFAEAAQLAEKALSNLRPDSYVSRTLSFSVLGQCALCLGQLDRALLLLQDAERLAFQQGLLQQRLWTLCLISDAYTARGDIATALQTQQTAMDMAHEQCFEQAPHMEFLYRNRLHLLIEQGDLAQAERLLTQGEAVMEPLGQYGLLNMHVHRGMIALWRGQKSVARNFAFQVHYLLQNHRFHTDWTAHALEFLLACQQAAILDFDWSWHWQPHPSDTDACNHFFQHYQRVQAIWEYQRGDQAAAIERLNRCQKQAELYGLHLQWLKNALLLANWQLSDEGKEAWQDCAPFLSQLKPLQSLWLSQLFSAESRDRDWPDWALWYGQSTAQSPTPQRNDELLTKLNANHAIPTDAVTPKELQVLLLIGAGLNNDEIAANMHVAVSTVKSHIRRLYRKLDISKRSQAIHICQQLSS